MDRNRDNPIAQFVRERRQQARLTQVELADIAGVGLRFLRDVEQGKTSLNTAKVNQLLGLFGHELAPQKTRKNAR